LRDALAEFLAGVDGEGAGDVWSPEPPGRDTPGAAAANAAGLKRRGHGVRHSRRREALSPEFRAVVEKAAELERLLVGLSLEAPMSPGEESAARAGGRRADLADAFRAA
jgi:hypothetical protein